MCVVVRLLQSSMVDTGRVGQPQSSLNNTVVTRTQLATAYITQTSGTNRHPQCQRSRAQPLGFDHQSSQHILQLMLHCRCQSAQQLSAVQEAGQLPPGTDCSATCGAKTAQHCTSGSKHTQRVMVSWAGRCATLRLNFKTRTQQHAQQ